VSRRRREMCIGHARLCVCLSLAACPQYCTDPDVTWGNGRVKGCPLVVPYLADLQSVHGFRCYDNRAEREMSASACTRSMPGCYCGRLLHKTVTVRNSCCSLYRPNNAKCLLLLDDFIIMNPCPACPCPPSSKLSATPLCLTILSITRGAQRSKNGRTISVK